MAEHSVLLRGGTIYDGSGGAPYIGDLAIDGDTIARVGPTENGTTTAERVIDATGLAVAPGFINMLSWAAATLIADGRSQSDIRQGVTLEVFGEGVSLGPLTEPMRRFEQERQSDIRYDIDWTTLDEGLRSLERRGVACNIASFVGATTLRIHEVGNDDRPPTPDELQRMRQLTRQAMQDGALGVGSSLIYAPACFAGTDELVALAAEAARFGGMYISHIRNEASHLLEAVDELIDIARRASARAEIWHIKASGRPNWPKLDRVIERVDAARASGLGITADMYTYHASSTGLDATMPGWVQEGGHAAWVNRLKDRDLRQRLKHELRSATADGENEFLGADRILLVGFRNPALRHLTGKSLKDVASARGTSPEDTIMDLVVEDDSRVQCVYFTMSEDNVRKAVGIPWVAFCSDAGSLAPESVFLESGTHPRAYGSFARLLGKYVREERVIPLEEAIRKLTRFPADNLGLPRRGRLQPNYFADVVVFEPDTITDNATFERPHQYATGMQHVFVNGQQVLKDGAHTGALPGRVVRRTAA